MSSLLYIQTKITYIRIKIVKQKIKNTPLKSELKTVIQSRFLESADTTSCNIVVWTGKFDRTMLLLATTENKL